MKVLCHKQQLIFTNHGTFIAGVGKEKDANYVAGHYEDGTAESVSVSPLPGFQEIPDWVRRTATFRQSVKAGLIFEVQVAAPEPEPEVEQPKAEKAVEPVAEPTSGLASSSASGPAKQTAKTAK